MKKSDIPTAMDKAIEYFVDKELYEYAVKAKKAKDLFEISK
jgi:diacylglycerol kinase